jgi:hypothetical protein
MANDYDIEELSQRAERVLRETELIREDIEKSVTKLHATIETAKSLIDEITTRFSSDRI